MKTIYQVNTRIGRNWSVKEYNNYKDAIKAYNYSVYIASHFGIKGQIINLIKGVLDEDDEYISDEVIKSYVVGGEN